MDHLELCLPAGLALRLDDRPRARPQQERLALARALYHRTPSHPVDLCPLPSAAIIVLAHSAILGNLV